MPDIAEFSYKSLVKIVSMVWSCHQKTEQGKFRRYISAVLTNFLLFYTHSVSILGKNNAVKMIFENVTGGMYKQLLLQLPDF